LTQRSGPGVRQHLLPNLQLSRQPPIAGRGRIDGVAVSDPERIPTVKSQPPNVIGAVRKDTGYRLKSKIAGLIFFLGPLLRQDVLDGRDAEGAGEALLGEVHFDYRAGCIAFVVYPVAVEGQLGGGGAAHLFEDDLVPVLLV
jgi:hypothetical protein